jgi:hypothetical protein
MNKEHVIFCVFAFILGILVSDMYQNMCGCNSIVEGAEPPPASGGGGGEEPVKAAVEAAAEAAAEQVVVAETAVEDSNQTPIITGKHAIICLNGKITLDTSNLIP